MNSALTDQLITQLGELEAVLEREYNAIRQRDIVAVESLTQEKQGFVDELNRTAAAMGEALETLLAEDSSLTANKIRTAIAACAKANKTNGCAIESSQSFTASLLDVLLGKLPGGRTYTARGRLGTDAGSSAFGRV